MKYLVCQGAICQCNFGTSPDTLKVKTQTKHFINEESASEKLIATDKEIGTPFEKNFFGSCSKMNNKPCKVTITEWSEFYEGIDLAENGGKPLLDSSKATCPIGGKDCIKIIDHGQISKPGQRNIDNADEQVINSVNPLVEMNESKKKDDKMILNFKVKN